jgi:hypothetical protein
MCRRLIDQHVTDTIKFGELTNTKAQLQRWAFYFDLQSSLDKPILCLYTGVFFKVLQIVGDQSH